MLSNARCFTKKRAKMITDFQVVKKEISPRYFLLTLALTPLQIAKKENCDCAILF